MDRGIASDTTCRHKANGITPSITWRRVAWTEESLQTLPAGTKPTASHHRSPGGEWRGQRNRFRHYLQAQSQRHHTIDHLEESGVDRGIASDTTCGHKAKGITPSITWRREAWTEEALQTLPAGTKPRASHHRSPGGERRGQKKRFRHYLQAQSQGHHTIDHLEERGVDRRSASDTTCRHKAKGITPSIKVWTEEALQTLPAGTKPRTSNGLKERGMDRGSTWYSLKRRERAIISQMDTGTVWKATLRDRVKRIWAFLSIQTPSWTDKNSPGKNLCCWRCSTLVATHTLWTSQLIQKTARTSPRPHSKPVLQTEVKTMESYDFVVLGPSWPCKSTKVERKRTHIIMTLHAYKRILLKQGRIPLFLQYLRVPFFYWNKFTLTPSLLLENLVTLPPPPTAALLEWVGYNKVIWLQQHPKKKKMFLNMTKFSV